MEGPLVEAAQPRADAGEGQQLLRIVAEGVGRDHVEQRLDGLADPVHVMAVLLVGIGVMGGDALDLAQVLVVVLREPQVLALRRRGEASRTSGAA